jgi:stearoyl-CoA desaturase (delta-9 desaturase)
MRIFQPTPNSLLIGQIIAQLMIIPFIAYASPLEWGIMLFMYFYMLCFGVTIGYHRYLSHKHFVTSKFFEFFMYFGAHIMMIGPAIPWVAHHRKHHRFADTPEDPHAPIYKGFWYCYFCQVLIVPEIKYARDMLRSTIARMQIRFYWLINAIFGVTLYLIDPFAVIYAWLAPAGLAKVIGSLVFSYSHRNGKANEDTWLGLLTFGEGFHESHHEDQSNPAFHKKWDIGYHVIKAIKK